MLARVFALVALLVVAVFATDAEKKEKVDLAKVRRPHAPACVASARLLPPTDSGRARHALGGASTGSPVRSRAWRAVRPRV